MAAADVDEVYGELVRERGLVSVTDKALAHKVACALCDDGADVALVGRLLEQLPAKVEAAPVPPSSPLHDLRRLNDKQLAEMERLMLIAEGDTPPKRRRSGRMLTRRQLRLRQLGAEWDELERAGHKVDDAEWAKFGAVILALLPMHNGAPLGTIPGLWPQFFRYVEHMRGRDEGTGVAAVPAAADAAVPAAPTATNGSNVVPMHVLGPADPRQTPWYYNNQDGAA